MQAALPDKPEPQAALTPGEVTPLKPTLHKLHQQQVGDGNLLDVHRCTYVPHKARMPATASPVLSWIHTELTDIFQRLRLNSVTGIHIYI